MKTALIWGLAMVVMGCAGSRSARLGVTEGKFMPCPASPNCVSSQAQDKIHAIAPLAYRGSPDEARERLMAVIQGMKRARLVTAAGPYLHAEFTSAVFRFVDDVEFYLDDARPVIHVRSASRLGYADFGVNRKRVEAIRRAFAQAP